MIGHDVQLLNGLSVYVIVTVLHDRGNGRYIGQCMSSGDLWELWHIEFDSSSGNYFSQSFKRAS